MTRLAGRAGAGPNVPALEGLEPRTLMAAFSWSPQEVYLADLINRARSDPQAEAQRLGIDLTQGLTAGQIALIGPTQPLALDAILTQAARDHSLDMASRNFFDHINPSNLNPTQRAQALGYPGTVGENIGAQYLDVDALYRAWMLNAPERINILGLDMNFDAAFHYDHLGLGLAIGTRFSAYSSYFTADFGNPTAHGPTLLGVAYSDFDSSGSYEMGEGLADVRIDVFAAGAPNTAVGTYTTDAQGNYQIDVPDGNYRVVFTLANTGRVYAKRVSIAGQNVRLNATDDQMAVPPPPPPPDDHVNAGMWSDATVIGLDPSTGDGVSSGTIQVARDTDLFKFVASVSGLSRLVATAGDAGTPVRLRLFGSDTAPIAIGHASGSASADSEMLVNLVAGRTYYLQVEDISKAATGSYTVQVAGPTDPPPDPAAPTSVGGGHAITAGFADAHDSLAFLESHGRPIFSQRNDNGTWSRVDLFAAAGGPAITGDLATWVDPKDSLVYVAGVSDYGLMLYKRSGDGSWSVRDLSNEVVGPEQIVSGLTVLTDAVNRVQILALVADGALVCYGQNGVVTASGGWRFRYANIADRDLTPNGISMPTLAGTMASWRSPSGWLNIAGVDDSGGVVLFSQPPASGNSAAGAWTLKNLSALSSAPSLTGNLVGAFVAGRTTISGTDASGHLWNIDQRLDGSWRSRDITAAIGGPALASGGLSGYVNRRGASIVVGLSPAGELVAYRSIYRGSKFAARWTSSVVSSLMPFIPTLMGRVDAAFRWVGGTAIVAATTVDGQAVRFAFRPWSGWSFENVSSLLVV